MQLIVNGEERKSNAKNIEELIKELEIEGKVMATAVNMNVVKKQDWATCELKENDKIELLKFVGGG